MSCWGSIALPALAQQPPAPPLQPLPLPLPPAPVQPPPPSEPPPPAPHYYDWSVVSAPPGCAGRFGLDDGGRHARPGLRRPRVPRARVPSGWRPRERDPGDFMDTRLSWTFGDDDFLHPTGSSFPLSPSFSIGDRPQYRLFFDALNSRFAGRENLTHLVMYKKMPGFIPRLTTEAADRPPLRPRRAGGEHRQPELGALRRGLVSAPLLQHGHGPARRHLARPSSRSTPTASASVTSTTSPGAARPRRSTSRSSRASRAARRAQDRSTTTTLLRVRRLQDRRRSSSRSRCSAPARTATSTTVDVADTNYGFLGGLGWDPLEHLRFDVGRRLLPAGTLRPARRPRRARLHVRRERARPRAQQHARARSRSTSRSTETTRWRR